MAQTIENKLGVKEKIKGRLSKIMLPFVFASTLATSGCATFFNYAADEISKPSQQQIEQGRAELEKAYREDFPQTLEDIKRSKRLISYVENKEQDKMAFIWRAYAGQQDRDNDFVIIDKKTNKMISGERTKDVSEYGVKKRDNKIMFLAWEFSKYGQSTSEAPINQRWEHSKAYTINWDGTGKQEIDKNKYYYYDAAKDDIFFKSQEASKSNN